MMLQVSSSLLLFLTFRLIICIGGISSNIAVKLNSNHISIENANNLRSYIVNNGGYINDKVDVDISPYGYCLKANSYIKAKELLIKIPSNLCFESSGDYALEDVAYKLCIERKKSSESMYQSFFNVLPQDVTDTLPAIWNTNRLELIKGTSIYSDAVAMLNKWKCDNPFNKADGSLVSMGITQDDYIWARATLQGRCNSFHNKAVAFLPFIGFANHNDNLKYANYPSRGYANEYYQLHVNELLTKDQEITISYGDMSFQQKLLSFGWVDRTNALGSFCITPFTYVDGKDYNVEIKTAINYPTMNARVEVIKVIDNLKKKINNGTISDSSIIQQLKSSMEAKLKALHPLMMNIDDADDYLHIVKVEHNAALQILEVVESLL